MKAATRQKQWLKPPSLWVLSAQEGRRYRLEQVNCIIFGEEFPPSRAENGCENVQAEVSFKEIAFASLIISCGMWRVKHCAMSPQRAYHWGLCHLWACVTLPCISFISGELLMVSYKPWIAYSADTGRALLRKKHLGRAIVIYDGSLRG